MESAGTGQPDKESGDGARKKTILKRTGLAAAVVVVLALGGAGGYLLGRNSGEDLDAARAEGATAGMTRGKATGGDVYAQGDAQGRHVTYGPAYREAYRAAYRAAFKGTDLAVPKAEQVSVLVP